MRTWNVSSCSSGNSKPRSCLTNSDGDERFPRTFIIHFEQAPTLESNSAVLATNGTQALRMITAYPANTVRRVVDEGGITGLDRLEVEATAQGVDYFLNVLQAKDSSGSDVTATLTDAGSSFRSTSRTRRLAARRSYCRRARRPPAELLPSTARRPRRC